MYSDKKKMSKNKKTFIMLIFDILAFYFFQIFIIK